MSSDDSSGFGWAQSNASSENRGVLLIRMSPIERALSALLHVCHARSSRIHPHHGSYYTAKCTRTQCSSLQLHCRRPRVHHDLYSRLSIDLRYTLCVHVLLLQFRSVSQRHSSAVGIETKASVLCTSDRQLINFSAHCHSLQSHTYLDLPPGPFGPALWVLLYCWPVHHSWQVLHHPRAKHAAKHMHKHSM